MNKKLKTVLIVSFLILGILMRLQNINGLPIDAHPMRQTDTESVAYNFAFKNANILLPQASLIRPISNTDGYFFLEFPVYQYAISLIYRVFGWNLSAGRIFNLLLFIGTCFFLYKFIKLIFNEKNAIWTLFLFTFAPGSIFFLGHAFHPDVFAIFTFTLSLYTLVKWTKNNKSLRFLTFSTCALAISIATRPFIALFIPGILLFLYLKKIRRWVFAVYLFTPLLYGFWRIWQTHFPQADSSWENWVLDGRNQLFQLQVLKNLIFKNVIGEVMGKFTALFAGVGAISICFCREKNKWIIFYWLLTLPIYWFLVPNGNIIHQYYANIYIITFCILGSFGILTLLKVIKNKKISIIFIVIIALLVIYNGYRTSSYFFLSRVSPEHQLIAKAIGKCIPYDKKIVYLAINNSIPMSLVHRQGWVMGYWPTDVDTSIERILSMKKYGASYIVSGKDNTDISMIEWGELKKTMLEVCNSPFIRVLQFK